MSGQGENRDGSDAQDGGQDDVHSESYIMAREGRIQSHKSSSAVDLPASKLISSKSSSLVADVKIIKQDYDN